MTDPTADLSAPSRRRFRPAGVSMATRLAAAVVGVSFISLAVVTAVGLDSGFDLGRTIYEGRLVSANQSANFDVSSELNSTRATAGALALSPETAAAITEFSAGIDELASVPDFDVRAARDHLVDTYRPIYLEPDDGRGPTPVDEVVPTDPAAIYLQSEYSTSTDSIDSPSLVDDAGDGSTWSATHAHVHSGYRRVIHELDLLDVYLVQPSEARVVYSVNKRPDLGTSLVAGPFGGSVLADTVNQVIDDPSAGTAVSDLSRYAAMPGRVIGVMASPVIDSDRLVGVIALAYDGAVFTDVVSADGQWAKTGIPPSGDVYLVGSDGTLRSDPRPYTEHSSAFLDASQDSGLLSRTERTTIEITGTTVLEQPAVGSTIRAGQNDDTDVAGRVSMTGTDVFSTVTPLAFDALDWYVVAEVDTHAAESSLGNFRDRLVVGTALFIVLIAFLAVAWATAVMRPVRALSERLGSSSHSTGPVAIPEQSPVEMHHLAASFDTMSDTLDRQRVDLALAREDRLALMHRMLPAAVANRIAKGDVDAVDDVPQASVVVLVVLGLAQLVRPGAANTSRRLVDGLHAELDELADHHGVDRIKVVGDAYFGACGHDRPFIDHAPRVVAFASDARDAVRGLGVANDLDLDVAVGVHTGAVTVGIIGGDRLVYDVWGDTITIAHHLARRAAAGDILISDTTHALLPDALPSDAASAVDGESVWRLAQTATGGLH